MGRPRNDPPSVFVDVRLYLRPGIDDDLIAFFRKCPTGSGLRPALVKAALRGSGLEDIGEIGESFLGDMVDTFDEQMW